MSKHIIIWHQNAKYDDNIEVYSKDPSYVVIADRSDLLMLKNIDESVLPGIYVLLNSENKRYVGQASSSVISRLTQHEKNKTWWEKVLFFGRDDGQLDKSQLDYLERKLIKLFFDSGFDLDNGDTGNSSFIAPYQRGKAESLLENTLQIIEDTAKVQLFKKYRAKKSADTGARAVSGATEGVLGSEGVVAADPVSVPSTGAVGGLTNTKSITFGYRLSDSLGNEISSAKLRHIYINWIKKLVEEDSYKQKFYEMLSNGSAVFRSKEIYAHNKCETEFLGDNLYLMTNLSIKDIRRRIEKLAELLEIEVNVEQIS